LAVEYQPRARVIDHEPDERAPECWQAKGACWWLVAQPYAKLTETYALRGFADRSQPPSFAEAITAVGGLRRKANQRHDYALVFAFWPAEANQAYWGDRQARLNLAS
jgi:hypothetical protein